MTSKELREERAKVFKRMREMTDKITAEKRDFNAEEKPNWEAANKDYDALSSRIEIAERMERAEGEQRGGGRDRAPGREDRDTREDRDDNDNDMTDSELGRQVRQVKPEIVGLALRGWCLQQSGLDVEERHVKAARIAGIRLTQRTLKLELNQRAMTAKEFRAMSAVDLTVGGTMVAPTFANSLESAMLAFGPMRQVAQVVRTETGADMPWPTANDTGNEGEIVGENTATGNQDPATGAMKVGAYKFSSKIIKVGTELLEDTAFDLPSELGRMCGERIGRNQNRKFTVGTGAGQPKGIVEAATLGVTTASPTAITADELLDLIGSVDPAYRLSAELMMADSTLTAVRKLKDSQNRYLFQDAPAGASPTIHGVKYQINQHMAAIAALAKTVLYGQLDKYKIRDVRTVRLRRLVERFADADQEGFVAFMRSDGNLLDAGVAPVKYLQQHS